MQQRVLGVRPVRGQRLHQTPAQLRQLRDFVELGQRVLVVDGAARLDLPRRHHQRRQLPHERPQLRLCVAGVVGQYRRPQLHRLRTAAHRRVTAAAAIPLRPKVREPHLGQAGLGAQHNQRQVQRSSRFLIN